MNYDFSLINWYLAGGIFLGIILIQLGTFLAVKACIDNLKDTLSELNASTNMMLGNHTQSLSSKIDILATKPEFPVSISTDIQDMSSKIDTLMSYAESQFLTPEDLIALDSNDTNNAPPQEVEIMLVDTFTDLITKFAENRKKVSSSFAGQDFEVVVTVRKPTNV